MADVPPKWADIPRKGFLILHHTVAPSWSTTDYSVVCPGYDFQVMADGAIHVGDRKYNSQGCHAFKCNCNTTGIGLQGCFGGQLSPGVQCTPANRGNSFPTVAQECAVGYIWHHTGIPGGEAKLKPHRWCVFHGTCGGSATDKPCPGTNLTGGAGASTDYFNNAGLAMRTRIDAKRNQYRGCDRCACT